MSNPKEFELEIVIKQYTEASSNVFDPPNEYEVFKFTKTFDVTAPWRGKDSLAETMEELTQKAYDETLDYLQQMCDHDFGDRDDDYPYHIDPMCLICGYVEVREPADYVGTNED